MAFQEAEEKKTSARIRSSDRVLSAIAADPWAIRENALRTIVDIATRCHDKPEALEKVQGALKPGTRSVTVRDRVAVLPVIGPIFPRANLFTDISGATALTSVARDFSKAEADPEVDHIILDMDTPGGQVTGVADFAEMVANSTKHVTAFVGGQASSAGYWIASAADEVVLSPTAVVGSVGAMIEVIPNDSDGFVFRSTQSPLKNADPSSEDGAKAYQSEVDDLAQVFVEDVAKYRGVGVDTVLADFGRGGVLVGAKAVAAGMADRVASVETVIAGLAGQDGGKSMSDDKQPEITQALIASDYPAIYAAIQAEAATTERGRIQGVLSAGLPGHEDLINKLAFDGKTSPGEAALQVNQAEKGARVTQLDEYKKKGDLGVTTTTEQDGGLGEDATVEEKCAHEWKHNPKVRDEFTSLEVYTACVKGDGTHRVLVAGGK